MGGISDLFCPLLLDSTKTNSTLMLAKAKRLESTPLQIKFISPYLNIRIDIFLSQPFVLFL